MGKCCFSFFPSQFLFLWRVARIVNLPQTGTVARLGNQISASWLDYPFASGSTEEATDEVSYEVIFCNPPLVAHETGLVLFLFLPVFLTDPTTSAAVIFSIILRSSSASNRWGPAWMLPAWQETRLISSWVALCMDGCPFYTRENKFSEWQSSLGPAVSGDEETPQLWKLDSVKKKKSQDLVKEIGGRGRS